MMSVSFDAFATRSIDPYPAQPRAAIDAFGERIYAPLNNGHAVVASARCSELQIE